MESRVIAKESTPLVTLLMASFDYIGDVPLKRHFIFSRCFCVSLLPLSTLIFQPVFDVHSNLVV